MKLRKIAQFKIIECECELLNSTQFSKNIIRILKFNINKAS